MKIMSLVLPLLAFAVVTKVYNQKREHPKVVVIIDIDAPVKESFEYIVPVNLPHIFKRYKNLPAIVSTSNKKLWYTPGMVRTVYFEDGNTAKEYLFTVNPYSDFSYKIEDFTSPLKRLAKRIKGQWIFTKLENGKTHIVWSYEIIPKNFLAQFIINAFFKKNIKGLLNNALTVLKEDLEKNQEQP